MPDLSGTQVKGSISRSVLLPLLILGPFLVVGAAWLHNAQLRQSLERQAEDNATTVVSSLALGLETMNHDPEIQRFVTALSAERNLRSIAIVRASDRRVLASSSLADIGKPLDELTDETARRELREELETGSRIWHTSVDGKTYSAVTMASLTASRIGQPAASEKAAIYAALDLSKPMAQIQRQAMLFGATFIAVWVAILGLLAFQLERKVLLPAARIREGLEKSRETGARRRVDAGADGELGMLATTLNQTFEALDKSESRFRALFDSMSIGVTVHDGNGAVADVNPAAEQILSTTRESMVGRTTLEGGWECLHEDGTPFTPEERPSSMVARTGNPITELTMGLRLAGWSEVRWMLVNATASHAGRSGDVDAIFVMYADISARRKSMEEIRTLALQVTQAPFAIMRTGVDRKISWVNDAFHALSGFSLEEAVGRTPGSLLQGPGTDRETICKLREALNSLRQVRAEILNYKKSGETYWAELTITPLHSASNKHIGFVGFASDITKRVEAAADLEAARDRLSLLNKELEERVVERTLQVRRQAAALEASVEGIALYLDGHSIYTNHTQISLFGIASPDAIGMPWQLFYTPDSRPILEPFFDGSATAGRGIGARGRRADGSAFEAEVDVITLPDGVRVVVSRDVTERVRAQRQLHESKRFLEAILDTFPMSVFWKDRESRYLGCNAAFASNAAVPPSEIVGKSDWDMPWAANHAEAYRRDDAAVMSQGRPKLAILESLKRADGTSVWIETNKVPLCDSTGTIIGMLGSFQDVTTRVRSEQSMREREARYRALMNGSGDAIILAAMDGCLLEANRKAEELLGYTEAELSRMMMTDIHPSDFHDEARRSFARLAENGSEEELDFPLLRKDGSVVYADIQATLIDLGDRVIAHGSFRDVTARREAAKRLRELSNKLELSLESGQIGCWGYDAETGKLEWDDRMFALYGISPPDFPESQEVWETALTEQDRSAVDNLLKECIRDAKPFDAQFTIRLPNGQVRHIQAKANMIPGDSGATRRVVGINYDISAMIAREKTLEELNRQLEMATRQKDEFLANMSHELRTPLNSILGMSEAIQIGVYGPLDQPKVQPIQRIEESGRHLLSLINDILDLAKIEAGKIALAPEPTNISALCTSVVRLMEETARGKGIELSSGYDPDIPDMLVDPRRLRQILLNLLSNAVKFTQPGGGVRLETKLDRAAQTMVISVSDTGDGIPADKLSLLFQPFTQLEPALTRRHGGTGLGLSIVKKLVELHGGSVAVQSTVGKGSVFSVRCPCIPSAPSSPAVSKIEADSLAKSTTTAPELPKVLIVEDNEANVQLVRDFLHATGYRTDVATNGVEAVAMAGSLQYSLVLMDVQMPEMDGMEATRRIRALPGTDQLPIVALTSFAMPGDREKCLSAGMTDYMAKPISLRVLGILLKSLIQKPRKEKGSDGNTAPR